MNRQGYSRRSFVGSMLGASAVACGLNSRTTACQPPQEKAELAGAPEIVEAPRILKSLKWGMIQMDGDVQSKFEAARAAGFHGVELDSPGGPAAAEVRAAVESTGLVVDGTVDSTHWRIRLSAPERTQREQGRADLITALHDTAAWGGHSVLLVPGHGGDGTKEETWQRSGEQIKKALPTAARLGIHILIENVWNHMFYEHDGPNDQTADQLASYVDQFESPWVGVQFDIGNHQKYGDPASWIRTLGKRIVKLDVKDWSPEDGFCKIGDGAVNWPKVVDALEQINFVGWAAAEVAGGGPDRLEEIAHRMDLALSL